MLIRDRHDLPALLAMLLRTTVKVDTERALRVIFRHLLCSEGDAQDGRESSADPVSRVSVSGDGHHFRGTGKRLHSSLNPMDSDIVDVVFGKNGEDGCISIAARGLFGGVRMDRDPEHDMVVEDVLAFFISGRETHRQHRRHANAPNLLLEQSDDLRSNRLLPKLVFEDRVVGGVSSLHRDGGVPLLGPLFGDGVMSRPRTAL